MNEFETNGPEYEPVAAGPAEGAKPVAFCQNCGRPLDETTKRVVGPAVYCEPCLQARLGGRPVAGAPGSASGPESWSIPSNWNPGSAPNPGLAALLGAIPGVGAMYNEQYAKGIFHLIVFSLLVSLSHSAGIFTLLVLGWEAYMVVEAHHTARARRDGLPLPNPFGLNEIGERLGFARGWQAPPATGAPWTPPAGPGAGQPFAGGMPPVQPHAANSGWTPTAAGAPAVAAAGSAWGAPAEGFDPHAAVPPTSFPGGNYGAHYRPVAESPNDFANRMGQDVNWRFGQGYVPPVAPPYGVPYTSVPPIDVPVVPPRGNRFPAGAVWLIGLGTLFLLSTTGIFETTLGWSLVGFVLIGLAVWVFFTRMSSTGPLVGDDGSPGYMLRVVRALWPSVWIGLTGVLLLLNEFDLVPWKRSWPLYIILAGVMTLVQRAALNTAARGMQYGMPPVSAPPAPATSAGSAYSVVPPADAATTDSSSNEGVR